MFGALMHSRITKIVMMLASSVVLVTGATATAPSGGATLQGTITDPSGAAAVGAQIHVIAIQTGVVRDVVTNGDGCSWSPNVTPASSKLSGQPHRRSPA